MSESGGSEIEEVGGRGPDYFTARHKETDQDHSRLLSSSFSWDHSSNFTSTLDIEAIKVSISLLSTYHIKD